MRGSEKANKTYSRAKVYSEKVIEKERKTKS